MRLNKKNHAMGDYYACFCGRFKVKKLLIIYSVIINEAVFIIVII